MRRSKRASTYRPLKLESLEERTLMAVSSGLGFLVPETVPALLSEGTLPVDLPAIDPDSPSLPATTSAEAWGTVVALSPIDINNDGLVSGSDLTLLSKAWISKAGNPRWNSACDIDRDGVVGPGDMTLLSMNWLKKGTDLPDAWKDYEIIPGDITLWGADPTYVSVSDEIVTMNARTGTRTATCPFTSFAEEYRFSAVVSSASRSNGVRFGLKVAVQESGACYYVTIQASQVNLYYQDGDQNVTELSQRTDFTFQCDTFYSVWLQFKGGKLAFGVEDETILCVDADHLTGGGIGLFAERGIASFANLSVDPDPEDVFVTPTKSYAIVTEGTPLDNYVAFPDVCRLNDGRLMAVYYVGYSHVSTPTAGHPTGGRIAYSFSFDEGQTWTGLKTLADTPLDDRDPSIVQLPNGRILCNFFALGTDSYGNTLLLTELTESSDYGETWSEPVIVYSGYATSSPIRRLENGDLIFPLYRQADGTAWGAIGISENSGRTWSDPITIPRGKYRLDAETDIIQLSDGSLYAIQRTQMAYSISTDNGRSWSVSKDVGFTGQCPYLLRTSGGAILLAQRDPNTCLRISRDECETWSDPIIVDQVPGAYPSMVELRDGTILILYYEEGDGSNIRARRFTLNDDDSVTWELL